MPDEDRITVNFATLQQLSGDLEGILRVLNEKLDTLYERTAKAMLSWDGEAREAFIDELDKWSHSAGDLKATQASVSRPEARCRDCSRSVSSGRLTVLGFLR
ncbi:WXG100 family type VII secretion target [Streptomyces finlayi]|uniref:WXG100 family type VII secretion target n=1 Tax=Streptomyces finlayi TaxID=67296 RepID=A0A7G7BG79_9ACTN|nr:WXG100 family type VII secretion target [Streptomyces finlayi]QNE74344.1 WXG100 family type VII secretion target [Streptomyces finlayi]